MNADLKSIWPVLTRYNQRHLARIAMPLGGIGTGTVALGGRGDLRDWEIMNRPAKHFRPRFAREVTPFFVLRVDVPGAAPVVRLLEGPLEPSEYEGDFGSRAPNHGMPRFRQCHFDAAYPFGQVHLSDRDVPLTISLEAFNPLIPGDTDASSLPVAVLRYRVRNPNPLPINISIAGTIPNFIGIDGSQSKPAWGGRTEQVGAKGNRNRKRRAGNVQGIFMESKEVSPDDPAWGTMALATTASHGVSSRTAWRPEVRWGEGLLDFWQDFTDDGLLDARQDPGTPVPAASLAVTDTVPARGECAITFLLTWHFPNRQTWTPPEGDCGQGARIGNYYTTPFADAWQVARHVASNLQALENGSLAFVNALVESHLPVTVKEAALFNLAVLRSQTVFRTPDGKLYGFEGCCDSVGCCHGSCTHVWNYEQATAFLFGDLARTMRDVEFSHATDANGRMSFRVHLPLDRATEYGVAAADGQMGCIMKMYRDWQLSGDSEWLRSLWPHVRRSLEFCWKQGGWDADRDGVMEGCQHNTMDVEYFGPNPQMGTWYLGALRAAEEMARFLGENNFADLCRGLFERGRAWCDANLFNGEYYEHHIRAPKHANDVLPGLYAHMGGKDLTKPDYQLGAGCLVDQLVGQTMAHLCGLGYLLNPEHVRKTLLSIYRYNRCVGFHDHFNNMRSFALGQERALLMASYPHARPALPFPYFTEVMTGFEYTAAVGMLYEGMERQGLTCIADIRARYDGEKRNPFDEAECGRFYARAMASWGAILAITGFQYSAVVQTMHFAASKTTTTWFWSTGTAWGTFSQKPHAKGIRVKLKVLHGRLMLKRLELGKWGSLTVPRALSAGHSISGTIPPSGSTPPAVPSTF